MPPVLHWKEKGKGRITIDISKDDLRRARALLEERTSGESK
jgi:hypothetical protein